MLWNQPAIHIDFIKRSHPQKSNTPVGYWFLTKICGEGRVEIWRKTEQGDWVLEAHRTQGRNGFECSSGEASIHKRKGVVFATGELEKHLERLLQHYKRRNGFTAPQYEYWKLAPAICPSKIAATRATAGE